MQQTIHKTDQEKSPIEIAVDLFGTQKALADELGTDQSFVSQWVTGKRPVPPQFCREIERITAGKVTRYQLRPKVFGPQPVSEAPQ